MSAISFFVLISWYLLICSILINITRVLFSIFSSSSIFIWFIIEINLLSFIGIILFTTSSTIKNIRVKYFTFQVNASAILFFVLLINFYSLRILLKSIIFIICCKLGMAPIHVWFVRILSKLNWSLFLWISIPQKLIPLLIRSSVIDSYFIRYFLFISVFISTCYGITQTKNKKIMGASSVFRLNWIIYSIIRRLNSWLSFYLIYRLIRFILIFNYVSILKSVNIVGTLNIAKFMIVITIIFLGGIPPRPLFFIKIDLMVYGQYSILLVLSLILIVSSIVILYMYINLIINMLVSYNTYRLFYFSKSFPPLFYLFILLIFSSTFIFSLI